MHTVDDESVGWFYITPDHPRGSFNVYLPHYDGIVGKRRSYAIFYDVMEDESDRLEKGWCLQLVSLTCNDAQEYKDELFMNVNGERVVGPRYMKTDDTIALESLRPIPIDRAATIELWEQDSTTASRNDLLGAFTLQITDDFNLHEVHSQTFSWRADAVRDATYTLNYRVRQREWTPFELHSDIEPAGRKRKVRRYNC